MRTVAKRERAARCHDRPRLVQREQAQAYPFCAGGLVAASLAPVGERTAER